MEVLPKHFVSSTKATLMQEVEIIPTDVVFYAIEVESFASGNPPSKKEKNFFRFVAIDCRNI